ncbi:Transposase [Paractinoplanes atraurantiacus]|uniref:Transposase n=1 Tax=Paractinoplanes atraurantiacus TaxID=1036182 RepID=A0A285EYX9_9ACTN|nr:helix-turn-helix domain-containing protein [Actinoplanes atraurantiacus]SNY04260.1 Transposase [Actinoplanes atraurantiacus]
MPPSLEQKQEVTGNVARTCRYYGISRPTFYKWQRRYQDEGLAGLRDRSSAPHHCPNATHADIVHKIVYLRQNYHFGPVKIQMYLKRYHDITITSSAIYNILVRLGLNRLPASQRYTSREKRWKRYEKPLPGHRLQADLKFIDYVPQRLPFRVEVIQTDNGTEFQTEFHRHVLDKGIAHTYIKPASRTSTARWSARTASTPKSSTACWTASSSTTSCVNGRITTTTTARTAPWTVRRPTNALSRRLRPRCKRSPAVAHLGNPAAVRTSSFRAAARPR